MGIMVWSHNAGLREAAPPEADQSKPVVSSGYMSEESDTDSEEEGMVIITSFSIVTNQSTT